MQTLMEQVWDAYWQQEPAGTKAALERVVAVVQRFEKEKAMSDLISRDALLAALRKERDDYFNEHFHQDPSTGTWEASNAKEEWLESLDERIEQIEQFPAVEPIATLTNNNQPGWQNIIETAPNVTIDVGTKLYRAA